MEATEQVCVFPLVLTLLPFTEAVLLFSLLLLPFMEAVLTLMATGRER